MGRTSGMKPYPIPKVDHTVGSGNISGVRSDQAPTTITPISSNQTARCATCHALRPRVAKAMVATMYTRPETPDRINATGASSNFDSSWNPERHDAASASMAYTMTMIRPAPVVRSVVSAMTNYLQFVEHGGYSRA